MERCFILGYSLRDTFYYIRECLCAVAGEQMVTRQSRSGIGACAGSGAALWLSYGYCGGKETPRPKQLGEERVRFTFLLITEEIRIGPQTGQEPGGRNPRLQRPRRGAAYWPAPYGSLQPAFLENPGPPNQGSPHLQCGLGHPRSSTNYKMPYGPACR